MDTIQDSDTSDSSVQNSQLANLNISDSRETLISESEASINMITGETSRRQSTDVSTKKKESAREDYQKKIEEE